MPSWKKVVIAPDKFKGSLSAVEAARAIARGVRRASSRVETVESPMADGGEGTVEVFLTRGAVRKVAKVHGPLGKMVDAAYALQDQTAILEMASASGLGLLDRSQYDPTQSSTFGTGELIRAAIESGMPRIIIGLGGSATNDAGIGMLRALGVRFLDARDSPIDGGILECARLVSIDLRGLDSRIAKTRIDAALDVDNPLYGPNGATRTFAAQKGASPEQISELERILQHVADVAQSTLHLDYRDARGAGAAGGLGFALIAFLGAKVHAGVEIIARESGLGGLLDGAALCMTGEGKIDLQTLHGKTIDGVARLAQAKGVPTIAFGGAVEEGAAAQLSARGIDVIPISPEGTPAQESMHSASCFLESAACAAMKNRAQRIGL